MQSDEDLKFTGFYQMGMMLGYPECCVLSLCRGRFGCFLPDSTIAVLHSQKPDGFIPCPEHEAQILAGAKVSEILGRKRNYSDKKIDAMWKEYVAKKEPA